MAISSEVVKVLREKTGAGMMDCKKALEASNGDMDKAIEHLRKKGAATAQKRADRVANQGIIVSKVTNDGTLGVIVEVNCETDFVARNADFIAFANAVAGLVETKKPESVESLGSLSLNNGKTVTETLSDLIGKIGEKIAIRRFEIVAANGSIIESYTHMGSKIGVLVELAAQNKSTDHTTLARDIAMQVAAMNPSFVAREEVPKATVDQEMEIYRQQAKNEGKPDQILDRIANGRLEKYYQEIVLLEQSFIKDATKMIKDVVTDSAKKLNDSIQIRRFRRYQLGE